MKRKSLKERATKLTREKNVGKGIKEQAEQAGIKPYTGSMDKEAVLKAANNGKTFIPPIEKSNVLEDNESSEISNTDRKGEEENPTS